MNEADILAALNDRQALAATAWAEARGDWNQGNSSVEERIAVMCVIRNRLRVPRRYGDTFRAVCFRKWQFSCWNPGQDANHLAAVQFAYLLATNQAIADRLQIETLYLANGIITGEIMDRTGGATSYYAPKAMKPAGRKPRWVYINGKDGPEHPVAAAVGDQLFYRV